MKCEVIDDRLVFIKPSGAELRWLQSTLSWEDQDTDEKFCLLFEDQGVHWTYQHLWRPLSLKYPYKFEVSGNEIVLNDIDHMVSKDLLEGITLDDFQVHCVAKALKRMKGISQIPTGGGKTEIMIALLRILLDSGEINRSLILVPTIFTAQQFVSRAYSRGFSKEEITYVSGDNPDYSGKIVVAVFNSIYRGISVEKEKTLNLLRDCTVSIYDECHHGSANSYVAITERLKHSKYILGYTGTPYREDDVLSSPVDSILYGLSGAVVIKISHKYLRSIGRIAEPIIHFKQMPGRSSFYRQRYSTIYRNHIVNNELRNKHIVDYAKKFSSLGFPTLILVQRHEHALNLISQLKDCSPIAIFGGGKAVQLDEFGLTQERTIEFDNFKDEFTKGRWDIIIATSVLDEGVDLPSVGAVIMAVGQKSKIKTLQRLGRGLRSKKGINRVYILDFQDRAHAYLSSQSKKRRLLFEDIDATLVDDEKLFNRLIYQHSEDNKLNSNA